MTRFVTGFSSFSVRQGRSKQRWPLKRRFPGAQRSSHLAGEIRRVSFSQGASTSGQIRATRVFSVGKNVIVNRRYGGDDFCPPFLVYYTQ